jgi:hypothetical protein
MKREHILIISSLALLLVLGAYFSTFYQVHQSMNYQVNQPTSIVKISIPPYSGRAPVGFNVTDLLTGRYRYRWNFTVVVGINNTVSWINNDTIEHTVSAFSVPSGAEPFNSALIAPGESFTVTLSVPGVYKYTCMWHPWLAGEITVKLRK